MSEAAIGLSWDAWALGAGGGIGRIGYEHWSAIITYRGADDPHYQCKEIHAARDRHL